MMAISKIGHDPQGLREKWIDLAWAAAVTPGGKKDREIIERIRVLAIGQMDVGNALRAWDALDHADEARWNSIDKYLSAAGRWREAAEVIDEPENGTVSSSPELHAYLAATLRRAGLEDRAVEHDGWAERLSLGFPQSCIRIGDHYTYGGDPERAAVWYERAAFQADPSSGDFVAALGSYSDSAFERGSWKIAASCYEALAQVHASRNFAGNVLGVYTRARLSADLAAALAVLPVEKDRAVSLLQGIHRNFATDGVLADDFFPLLRKVGLQEELKQWFDESWKNISEIIRRYPESDNSRNTAAWFASRAGMKLQEARKHLDYALDRNPGQPAYLDTLAETYFAAGDRAAAIRWSDLALMHYPLTEPTPPFDLMIRKQNHRFHSGEKP